MSVSAALLPFAGRPCRSGVGRFLSSPTPPTPKSMGPPNVVFTLAGSTGERNTLSFHKKMECEQWFIENGSTTQIPRRQRCGTAGKRRVASCNSQVI